MVGQERPSGGQPAAHPQPAEEAQLGVVGQELSVLAGRALGLAGDAADGRALRGDAEVISNQCHLGSVVQV